MNENETIKEQIRLLQQSYAEIVGLRHENEIMNARLQMFDNMMLVFKTQLNYGSQGMKEDIAWKIKKHLDSHEQ